MSEKRVFIGRSPVGAQEPVYVVAEIGINHNGSLDLARRLIDGAVLAGCDAVKFQKRTPELCVPREQWNVERDTPWGRMKYIDYRHKVEFGLDEYRAIDAHCRERGIAWFASPWDEQAVEFLEQFELPCHKAASATITDLPLLRAMRATGRPLVMSTGMSTMDEIERAVGEVGTAELVLLHSTSSYPCPLEQVNLRMIDTLAERWPEVPIGYSGHEAGLSPTLAAVAMGAAMVERHITLDRTMWGSDQGASVEIVDLVRLVGGIREIERSLGDGIKRMHELEWSARKRLRRSEPAPVQNGHAGHHVSAANG